VIAVHDTRRTRLVLVVLLIAAIALISFDYRDGSSGFFRDLRNTGSSIFGGAERAMSDVADPIGRFFSGSGTGDSSKQVTSLQREVIKLRAELSQARLTKADYAQVKAVWSLAGKGQYRIVFANVIASGQGYQETVTLDAGSKDGVSPDETVLNGRGLVGRVTTVSPGTATVLLADDASSHVGVDLAPSGQVGYVTGPGVTRAGGGLMRLQMLTGNVALKSGEQLVSEASVHDRPYVPGVPVGMITKVTTSAGALTATALVRPYVNFSNLSIVGIVVGGPRHNPGFSVLPPAPHVKPTPTVTITVRPGVNGSPGTTTSPGTSPSSTTGTGG
jgi:rod shape-determining protein MreC